MLSEPKTARALALERRSWPSCSLRMGFPIRVRRTLRPSRPRALRGSGAELIS